MNYECVEDECCEDEEGAPNEALRAAQRTAAMPVSPSTSTRSQRVSPSPSNHASSPWLRETEAAAYARVSTRTIQRWMANGLPHYAVGGIVLFRSKDLDRYVERTLTIKTPRRVRRKVAR